MGLHVFLGELCINLVYSASSKSLFLCSSLVKTLCFTCFNVNVSIAYLILCLCFLFFPFFPHIVLLIQKSILVFHKDIVLYLLSALQCGWLYNTSWKMYCSFIVNANVDFSFKIPKKKKHFTISNLGCANSSIHPSSHPLLMPAFPCTQGCRGLLEPPTCDKADRRVTPWKSYQFIAGHFYAN